MAKNKPEEIKPEDKKEEKSVKTLTANTSFNDRYTGVNYEKGTKFVIADVEKTEEVSKAEYKISEARAKQLKASGYVD